MNRHQLSSVLVAFACCFTGLGCLTTEGLHLPGLGVEAGELSYDDWAACWGLNATESRSATALARLANDPTADKLARRDCVYELFNTHVTPGMTLGAVACLLEKPTWLEQIHRYTWVIGMIPVGINDSDTSFAIYMFPELGNDMGAVYLRIDGDFDEDALLDVLHGRAFGPAARAKIREIGFAWPPPDEGVRRIVSGSLGCIEYFENGRLVSRRWRPADGRFKVFDSPGNSRVHGGIR